MRDNLQFTISCFLSLILIAFSLIACKKGEPPQPTPIVKREVVKSPSPQPPPQEVTPVVEPVPAGLKQGVEEKAEETTAEWKKRNPFKPFVSKALERAPEVAEPKVPLQRFDMGQLKLVAIIWGINSPTAMVEAPDGKGYIVKKGDLIGNRNGVVARVERDKVIVEERFKNYLGEVQTQEIELKLPQPEGGLL